MIKFRISEYPISYSMSLDRAVFILLTTSYIMAEGDSSSDEGLERLKEAVQGVNLPGFSQTEPKK